MTDEGPVQWQCHAISMAAIHNGASINSHLMTLISQYRFLNVSIMNRLKSSTTSCENLDFWRTMFMKVNATS